MLLPPIEPEQTPAGIAVDPRTLERVIPRSRRPDGTFRPQRAVRPGFVPQEDVKIYRSRRAIAAEANALPVGHVFGWTPPSKPAASASKPKSASAAAASALPSVDAACLSPAAKKNAKRKEKRKQAKVVESWEDENESENDGGNGSKGPDGLELCASAPPEKEEETEGTVLAASSRLELSGARHREGREEGPEGSEAAVAVGLDVLPPSTPKAASDSIADALGNLRLQGDRDRDRDRDRHKEESEDSEMAVTAGVDAPPPQDTPIAPSAPKPRPRGNKDKSGKGGPEAVGPTSVDASPPSHTPKASSPPSMRAGGAADVAVVSGRSRSRKSGKKSS